VKVETAELGVNDVLVFTANQILTSEQFTKFRNLLKGNLERAGLSNTKFIALDSSTSVQVIKVGRKSDVPCEVSTEQWRMFASLLNETFGERGKKDDSLNLKGMSLPEKWAKSAVKRKASVSDWAGLSFIEAEQRAQALCAEAGRTGMTKYVPSHLEEWHKIMIPLREECARSKGLA
jgi:hypothetical protein